MSPAHRFRSAVALLATAALALTGCRDATAPADVSGTYTLQRLGDAPLPAPYGGSAGSGFNALTAESLRLDAGGSAQFESRRSHTAGYANGYNPSGNYDYVVQGTGTWQRRGDTVVVQLDYTGDRPWNPSSGTATLRLRPTSGGLTEYQDPVSSYMAVLRTYRQ